MDHERKESSDHARIDATGEQTAFQIVQAGLDEMNGTLPEDLKAAHPPQPRTEIEKTHPNKWIAVLPTQVDPATVSMIEGRFFIEAPSRKVLERMLQPLVEKFPDLKFFTYSTKPILHKW